MAKTQNKAKDDMANKTFEEKMLILDETIAKMENKDISLEESFELYNSGMELLKQCNADVDSIEKKVLVLKKDGEFNEL